MNHKVILFLLAASILICVHLADSRAGESSDQVRRGECQVSGDKWIKAKKTT